MTLIFHLAYLGRSVRQVGDEVEFLDGKAPPTIEELEASRPAALAAWQAEQAAGELPARRAQMAEILDALPLETRAAFFPTRVAVEAALDRGMPDLARAIVESVVVPPELEATKEQILELFP